MLYLRIYINHCEYFPLYFTTTMHIGTSAAVFFACLSLCLCHDPPVSTLKLLWNGFNLSTVFPHYEERIQFYETVIFDRVRIVLHELEYYLDHDTCPTGFYCTENNTLATPCPPGTYNPLLGQESIDSCLACPFNSYCPEGSNTTIDCPAGTWGSQPNSGQKEDCSPCPYGFYCPFKSIELCPNGTYTHYTGNIQISDCMPCPSGHSCSLGEMKPCSQGYYTEDPGQSECLLCETGTYTYDYGWSEACPPCPPGYFCEVPGEAPEVCPEHSTSAQGARDVSECYCVPGLTCDPSVNICPPKTTMKPGGSSIADCICDEGYDCDYVYTGDVKIEITDRMNKEDPVLVHHDIKTMNGKKKQSTIRLLVEPENDFLHSFE